MAALVLQFLLLTAATPQALRDALIARTPPDTRVEVVSYQPSLAEGCTATRAELPPALASGRFAVRLTGANPQGNPCSGWAWLRLSVHARIAITTRAISEGAPLHDAVSFEERELLPGRAPLRALPEGAVAARSLPSGLALAPEHARVGLGNGAAVTVLLQSGGLALSLPGKLVPCGQGKTCAALPTGKRVQGTLAQNVLTVSQEQELPR